MLTILFRTIIIYSLLLCFMRLMGKRQLGELEITELVTTLLISEIATLPIEDITVPIMHAVIPLVTIFALEVMLSMILLKLPRLKNLASSRPSVLIRHGKPDQKEMLRIRITIDELISEIRQAGFATPEDVDYAILEQNGKISIIPRRAAQAVSPKDLGIAPAENGIMHTLIEDGTLNQYNLKLLKINEALIRAYLAERALIPQDVFYLGIDDGQNFYLIERESS